MATALEEPPVPTRRKGGFSMPKNAGLALQEAIQQERGVEQPKAETSSADTSADAQMRNPASTQAGTSASEEVSTGASAEVPPQVSEQVPTEARKPASTPARKGGGKSAISSITSSDSRLLQTIRDNLAARRNHPGGVKASVDMSPELSTRIKRYLLDNGNPAARILMLELVEAFLTEEGY